MTHPDQPSTHAVPPCAAILLAAGASTRLGRPKQLVLFQGEPLLRRAARLALAAGAAPVFVIVPGPSATAGATHPAPPQHEAETAAPAYTQALANLPVTILANSQAATGMGSSLRLGMATLATYAPRTARVLLLVCDQPLLRLDHLQALLAAHAGSPSGIAAASFQPAGQSAERPGVPAIFSRNHFPALAAAHGDQGARTLLRTLPITTVPIPEAATDIDTPEDISRLNAQT